MNKKRSSYKKTSRFPRQIMALVLALALMASVVPLYPGMNAIAADAFAGNTVQPILVVSGQGIIAGGTYTADNISNERSYTMDELKSLGEITQLYSAINTSPTRSIYLGKGISIDGLLQESNVAAADYGKYEIDVVAADGYTVKFDPAKTGQSATQGKPLKTPAFSVDRYYYPNIKELTVDLVDNKYTYSNETAAAVDGSIAKTILAWERGGDRGFPNIVPTATTALNADEKPLLLMMGQQNVWEQNNPLFNKTVNKILVGAALTDAAITIDGKAKTRSEILMMERSDRSYTYQTQGGNKTDHVRGVPLSVLLKGYSDNDTVKFTTADNYPKEGISMTFGQLKSANYMLAYEKVSDSSKSAGIYDTAKKDPSIYGYFALYGDSQQPAKMISSITVTPASGIDFSTSPFRHITNGGISGQDGPYDIDAITGATLTIEGPGVTKSVPLPIRELESQNAGAYRGTYTDKRSGTDWTLQYEGIKLSHIVNNMTSGDNGIHKTANAYKVLVKNRVRQTIAEFTLDQIAAADTAGKPIIIAYGTGTSDNATVAPFVYDGATGIKTALDNDDGPIKLVYDKSVFTSDPNPHYTEFGNVAYIYVAEQNAPGYKHNVAPYNTAENSQYVLTVTGDKIGREVNYTVEQLEAMVAYDNNGVPVADGMGYRDEYSLANSNYWYVNEYEGVQLWELLQKSGLPVEAAAGADKDTVVSFTATDNYKDFDKFSIEQVANPNLFGYYEKNPADLNDGKYTGNDAEDLRATGYPVLVAYGVNAYPYVIKNTLDGYMSGLSNDGGPLRIISGKMNYSHANGSKQAKLLDKIIVGTDNYYSTHKYNPNLSGLYKGIAENSTLNIKVISGADASGTVLKDQTYKVGDLEELLYAGTLTATQLKEAKIKGFYEAYKNANFYNDLYEGVSLPYFLENIVQLPGYKGTITFSNGTANLTMDLEEVLTFSGFNGTTKLSGLVPVIAYAKNGSPMVATNNASDGYEGTVTLAAGTPYEQKITVKNNGGPLAVMFPRETLDANTANSLTSVNSITINLVADKYSHTELPYSSLANNTVTVSGAGTRLTAAKTFTVADIEGKQTLAVTGDYNIKKSADSQSQTRYRGIPLYAFLSSTDIGLKPNASQVIVTCSDNTSYTFTLAEVYKSDYVNGQNKAINNLKMILAYGSAAIDNANPEDGLPLVISSSDEGYNAAYGNSGGPIRLVVGQTGTDDLNSDRILKDVTSIEVTASEMVSWNHSTSAIYQDYLDDTFQLQVVNSENSPIFNKTYTIAQLEAMTSLVERENISWIGTQEWEGINLWDFVLQEAGSINGVADPVSVTVHASDGFTKELRSILGLDALQNGVKDGTAYIPVILGYAHSGYPLVNDSDSDGYVALVDNDGGPLRLMIHNNQGACLSDTIKVVVKVGAGGTDPIPVEEKDFNIYGLKSGTVAMDIRAIKNITAGNGKTIADYTWKGNTDKVKGAYLADLLTEAGISGSGVKVDITTSDNFAGQGYKDLTLETIAKQKYFVAYDITTDGGTTWTAFSDADKQTTPVTSTVRIYRNYDDGSSTWYNRVTNVKGVTVTISEPVVFDICPAEGSAGGLPLAGIRSIWMDSADGLWVSTYGGGVAYKAANASTFTVYNKASTPALQTAVVSAVAVDKNGGVWMTQNASYTDPSGNQGVAYMKDGQITYYKETDSPATIPNDYVQEIQIDKDGKIWFGSFGGLTKYDPSKGTWTTWDQDYKDTDGESFPALSIDNINLDGKGGVWLGFYPNGAGTEADPFVGGFAHMSADGNITSYQYTADYDSTLGSSLLAQVWIRDIAVDRNGGAWVVASGSYSDLANVGGTIWYVDSTGKTTKFTGDQLLGDGKLTGNSEIRMVAMDPDGGLWFGTSADGVFYIASPSTTAPLTITAQYSGSTGSWAKAATWNNIYSLDFAGKTLYVGSSGGLAYKAFDFANSTDEPTVIESFTVSGAGAADIAYYVGGSYAKTFKGLANNAGKVSANYPYNGETHYVKGALLSTLLADAAVGQNTKITVKTSDGYTKTSYENIPYADIAAKNYFVAYDVGEGTDTLGKVADMDGNGATASFRIYRNLDSGAAGNKDNRIKGVTGIVVSAAGGGGGEVPVEYDLTINGNGAGKVAQYTIKELKNAAGLIKQTKSYSWLNSYGTTGSDDFEGVYLDNLLQDVVGLTSRAKSITVTAGDGYYRSFNLDSQPLGVYWTDIEGNKIMLAWKKNGTNCDLQLVVGQTDAAHVNKPMWVSDIKTITVNASSTSPGTGTPGNYEGNQGQSGNSGTTGSTPITGTITKTVKTIPLFSGGTASSRVALNDVRKAIEEINKNKHNSELKAVLEIDASSLVPAATGSAGSGQVNQTQVTLTADTLKALVNEKNITASIKTDLGIIVLPPEVLQQLNANGSQPVVVTLTASGQTPADGGTGLIGDRPVVDITITQGNQQVTSLGGRQIRAGISYKAQNTENQSKLLAYYINDKGESKPVKLSGFDDESNQMLFATVHLSLYAVGYNDVTFADVQKHWAQKNIEFLAAREIIKGKAAGVFDPDGNVTRAEFVTMLANSMDGIIVAGAKSAGFDDVAAAAWYAGFINWAVDKKIVSGYGDGNFGPNDLITREQMAVMADKFLQAIQADLNVVKAAASFKDQDKINSWAAASVSKMQQAGIINGRTDGSFAPQGTSTRAEAATVIKGYIESLLK